MDYTQLTSQQISLVVVALLGCLLPILLLDKLPQLRIPPIFDLRRSRQPTSEIVALRVYPIKSCRGFEVPKMLLTKRGLDLDRQWMFVDAATHEFLTIRQLPQMTLVNTRLCADGTELVISITGVVGAEVRIPTRPTARWLAAHTTLESVVVWKHRTDGYVYGDNVNAPFSTFFGRPVLLVLKGPTARVLGGNGAPRLLGRTESVRFADVLPVQIASEASLADLNQRLEERGQDRITVERFRPNIVIRGNVPWSEDSWKVVRFNGSGSMFSSGSQTLDLDVVARCARCQVPNVDPDTGDKHKKEPWDTLMSYRRIDEGIKFKPCFGMLSVPRSEGEITVGMRFEVMRETKDHRYVTGF